MAEITIQKLLEAGVHFGHQARRWNPKMKKFIFAERNGIYIIDLQKTQKLINKASDAVRRIVSDGGNILFVGTKPQASSAVKECAEKIGQYYVNNRWAGGMLTNYRTIRQSVKRLDHIEKMATDGTFELLTKKEVQNYEKQRERLLYMLEGIRDMHHLPDLMIVVDTRKEKIAVNEAARLGIPICAILDTNSDPDPITYPIPGNDDAIRAIELILGRLTESAEEGLRLRVDEKGLAEKESAVEEAEEADRERRRTGRPQRARGGERGGKGEGARPPRGEQSPVKQPGEKAVRHADEPVEAVETEPAETLAEPAEAAEAKPLKSAAPGEKPAAEKAAKAEKAEKTEE